MNKIFTISLILAGLIFANSAVFARTVTVTKNANPYNYYNTYQNPAYSADLDRIEDYMFGTIYKKESTNSRLNRIERRLFNKTYTSMNTADRMNNILSNYRNDTNAYYGNYLSNFYDNSTPVSRIRNRFIGTPTGFTPPIYNSPFGTLNGINRSFTSNRGYGYNNSIPMTTGTGIHILP